MMRHSNSQTALGAPGIYRLPRPPEHRLGGVRMDVCAFVGVAPRGPVRVPKEPEAWCHDRALVGLNVPVRRSIAVPVESWDDYKRLYGAFEGPGRLPYAVASFFEQGGRKAYIVRIVHDYETDAPPSGSSGGAVEHLNRQAVARGELKEVLVDGIENHHPQLTARNEGSWGNAIKASLGFSVEPVEFDLETTTRHEIVIPVDQSVPAGSLLRIHLDVGGVPRIEFRFATKAGRTGATSSTDIYSILTLDAELPALPIQIEVIKGDLVLTDGGATTERFTGLGLSSIHSRWMATVLYNESQLVYPDEAWIDAELRPGDGVDPPIDPIPGLASSIPFQGGEDRYTDIEPADFFDDGWVLGDPEPGNGVHALTHLPDLATVVVPDLYVPESLPGQQPVHDIPSLAGPDFRPCVEVKEGPGATVDKTHGLDGLLLDPSVPEDLETIVTLQQKLVYLADQLQRFVVLLDVPPGLEKKRVLRWRARFRSSYAAAYHPWLMIASSEDLRDNLILINPSAAAAGIIARQEIAFGISHGPANVIVAGAVKVERRIPPALHDELHPQGINVFLQERDGVRLTAARTLSRDSDYRQLSVRRLIIMLRRALEQQMTWLVFEPNGPLLWSDVRHLIGNYLRRLYNGGAFKGDTEEEAFFVRCDETLNSQRVIDAGQLIAEIGVAPAEPLEFLVVRITRGGDGTLTLGDQVHG